MRSVQDLYWLRMTRLMLPKKNWDWGWSAMNKESPTRSALEWQRVFDRCSDVDGIMILLGKNRFWHFSPCLHGVNAGPCEHDQHGFARLLRQGRGGWDDHQPLIWVEVMIFCLVVGCHEFYFPIYWVANHPKYIGNNHPKYIGNNHPKYIGNFIIPTDFHIF